MNTENLEYLRDNLKYLGFGDQQLLNDSLKEKISEGPAEFQLAAEQFYDDDYKLDATLYFRRGDKSDLYFFNKYEALLQKGDMPEKNRKHTFYITKGSGVTLKEAFNLLQGRAVNKNLISFEGTKYNAWIQLNFEEVGPNHQYKMRQYGVNYGFDLEKTLERYPIRELMTEESKAMLLRSLQRGNLQPAHFLKANKVEMKFIEANPEFKSINIYTSAMLAPQKSVKRPTLSGRNSASAKKFESEVEECKEEEESNVQEDGPGVEGKLFPPEPAEPISAPSAPQKKGGRK